MRNEPVNLAEAIARRLQPAEHVIRKSAETGA